MYIHLIIIQNTLKRAQKIKEIAEEELNQVKELNKTLVKMS